MNKDHVCKSEAALSHRLNEVNSLRARNDTLAIELANERILRYAAEAERDAETERCAKVAREFSLSPVVGKAIAALISGCQYPNCLDNDDERCPRMLLGECNIHEQN